MFVHNLAPGAVERLGFGFDALAVQNPRLIWCGISGYGPDGPYRDRKAYDMLVQAESGIISMTGTEDAPAKVGVSIADIGARTLCVLVDPRGAAEPEQDRLAASASTSRCSNA